MKREKAGDYVRNHVTFGTIRAMITHDHRHFVREARANRAHGEFCSFLLLFALS